MPRPSKRSSPSACCHQRQASSCTVAAYRDTWRLLLAYAHEHTRTTPERIDLADLDADLIGSFLTYLERQRHNSIRTRNARLAAIRSLFRFAALRHPEHADLIARVLAIPAKRHATGTVCYLTASEIDAILAAPDRSTWHGRRDHALLVLAVQTGLRVSELTALARPTCISTPVRTCDAPERVARNASHRSPSAPWPCCGSGCAGCPAARTPRCSPATPVRRLSTDAVGWLVAKHADTAADCCKTLHRKNITPHTLRHTAAMQLLHAGVDTTVIALWLGHESPRSTTPYLHADLALKERALARTAPPNTRPGRYHPPDKLLAFLEGL